MLAFHSLDMATACGSVAPVVRSTRKSRGCTSVSITSPHTTTATHFLATNGRYWKRFRVSVCSLAYTLPPL